MGEYGQTVYLYKLFYPNQSMNDSEAKKTILKSRILFKILNGQDNAIF